MTHRPLLLAHRGARTDSIPENSLPAFDRALEQGCDGFECDVRLTRCGCAVVCHNARVDGIAVSHAMRAQLPRLPCIEEVLRRYRGRGFMDIELKAPGLESCVLDALRKYPPERGCVLSSFLPQVALEIKARTGIVPVGIICSRASQLMNWRALPVDYVIVHQNLMTRRLAEIVHGAGRRIFAWGVTSHTTALRLSGWEVDAIIADNPQMLMESFAAKLV